MLLSLMFVALILCLLTGYPVAFVLSGISLIFALIGHMLGQFDMGFLAALPNRIYGIMSNDLLVAVPLFVFMGVMLQKAKIAESLLSNMARAFKSSPCGLGLSVMIVGTLLAASTGIVGATVITMGLISLPTMLKHGYHPRIATGSICAAGTLGQIIPPSIVLILLGDQISSAYQTAQLKLGNLSPHPISLADIFVGALVPGLVLVALYMLWQWIYSRRFPDHMPIPEQSEAILLKELIKSTIYPLALIILVLGSILTGLATATESAAIGAMGALILAKINHQLTRENLRETVQSTAHTCAMVFTILIGATFFTLVFRGYGGDDLVHEFLTNLPGGLFTVMLITMLLMFLLGFFLDFIEIIFVVVPIVAPIVLIMGADPIWLAIMIAINLQTSFLTPPFGFALFYLRGVAPDSIATSDIYKGVIPFVAIQMMVLGLLSAVPSLATWLPNAIYGQDTSVSQSDNIELQEDIPNYDVDF